ncbi:hypothetical protein J8655_19730 [Dickeya oryzae]|uniref:hypothetical protein n=1 Tax=Dickeya oryzae TaxID=1240404 RepID=UPI001AECC3A3|nr:hypothetical protein [Dickeya oryzae]MBP2847666.1 hypothetical protein [Dickeya oryzae]
MSSKEKRQQRAKSKKKKANIEKQKNIDNQPNGVTIKSEMIKLYKDIPFPDSQLGHLKKLIQVFINDAKKKTNNMPEGDDLLDCISAFNICYEKYCFDDSKYISEIEFYAKFSDEEYNDLFITKYENAMQQLKEEGLLN